MKKTNKIKKTKIELRASGWEEESPSEAYLLGVEVDSEPYGKAGELVCVPATSQERGGCHCLTVINRYDKEEATLDEDGKVFLFINLTSSEMKAFGEKLIKISKLHTKKKTIKK